MVIAIKYFFKLIGLIPIVWYRNGLISWLLMMSGFYLIGLGELSITEKYLTLFDHPKKIIDLFLNAATVYVVFYNVFQFLIKALFHKIIKKSVFEYLKGKGASSKLERSRELVEMRQSMIKGMNFPIEMGYLERDGVDVIKKEDISITPVQKEKAIILFSDMFTIWVCIFFHAVITSIFYFILIGY